MSDFIPYAPRTLPEAQMLEEADRFYELMDHRRSVRFFSDRPVPKKLIELAIQTASTAPSGAHRQPWRFVAISNADVKRQIREAAEKEEYRNYEGGRMPEAWLQALQPLGTGWEKPYLETVPWLVIVFAENHGLSTRGDRITNYYVKESVGIACGLFIAALHNMGLATLTHTPSPMKFLSEILQRPSNEKPYILFPVGFPADDCTVPDLARKDLDDMAVFVE